MRFEEPLLFAPIYQERVWGGQALREKFGREIPAHTPIGESWELVDRAEAQSVVVDGGWEGTTLHTLWREHREAVFGVSVLDAERFPIFVKILDAKELLSVQVHPPAHLAGRFGGEAKAEAWFFLDAEPGAEVFAGFRAGVDRTRFEAALRAGEVEAWLHRIAVQRGDVLWVPSGRCHAIGGGCLIAEVQQNSDTTFRVFDWNRVGMDGRPRALHVEESLECMDFGDLEPGLEPAEGERLLETPYFRMERWVLREAREGGAGEGAFFLVHAGLVECGGRVFERGATFWVPAAGAHLRLRPWGEEAAEVIRWSLPRFSDNR